LKNPAEDNRTHWLVKYDGVNMFFTRLLLFQSHFTSTAL
jgi:hypothetical protein